MSSPDRQALAFELNSKGMLGGNATGGALTSDRQQALSGVPGSLAATSGAGQYTTDFPDSTKNTAMISPPDPGYGTLFDFQPTVSRGFPNLSDYEFLKPQLHVGAKTTREQEKEDLYQHIERRFAEYRGRANKEQGLKNGLKTDKLQGTTALGGQYSSLSSRSLKEGLKKDTLKSGLIY